MLLLLSATVLPLGLTLALDRLCREPVRRGTALAAVTPPTQGGRPEV